MYFKSTILGLLMTAIAPLGVQSLPLKPEKGGTIPNVALTENQANLPQLSLGTQKSQAEDGGTVTVEVTSSEIVIGDLTVNVTTTFAPTSISTASTTARDVTVTFPDSPGGTTGTFTIPITDNSESGDGTIIIILNADSSGNDYELPAAPGDAVTTLNVIDDESLPVISIAGPDSAVAEDAGPVEFILSTDDISASTTLTVEFSLNGETDILGTNESSASVLFTDTNSDGTYEGNLSINLKDDESGYTCGNCSGSDKARIQVSLDDVTNIHYRTHTMDNLATANIVDDERLPKISITGPMSSTTEDRRAVNFTLIIDDPDYYYYLSGGDTVNLMIEYSLAGATNFLGRNTSPFSVSFEVNSSRTWEEILPIVLDNDTITDTNATLTVTLDNVTNTTYRPHATNNSATADIVDDERLPRISISGPRTNVIESAGLVNFVLSSNNMSADSTLMIEFSLSGASTFLGSNTSPVEVLFTDSNSDGTYQGILPIVLDDDEFYDTDATLTVTLDNVTNASYRTHVTNNSAIANIVDDETPPVLTLFNAHEPQSEDSKITVKVNSDTNVAGVLLVNVTTTFSPDELSNASTRPKDVRVVFPASPGGRTGTFTIPITNNGIVDPEDQTRSVTVQLNNDTSGTDYTVGSIKSTIIQVFDDETLPFISILSHSYRELTVVESERVVNFRLSTKDITSDTSIMIEYSVSGAESFLGTNTSPTSILFTDSNSDGTYEGILKIELDDDNVDEPNKELIVRLQDRTSNYYRLSRYSTSSKAFIIDDDGTPNLTLRNQDNFAEDLEALTVDVYSDKVIIGDFTVNVTTTFDPVGLSSASTKSRDVTVNFPTSPGGTTGTFTLPIIDNTILDPPDQTRSVTVQLNDDTSGNDYTISGSNTVQILIVDDEALPRISITGPDENVFEDSGSVRFMLSTEDLIGYTSLVIDYSLRGAENFLSTRSTSSSQNISFRDYDNDGIFTGSLNIYLNNDDVSDAKSTLTVTLDTTSAYYRPDPTANSATVDILDSDGLPVISITEPSSYYYNYTEFAEDSGPLNITLSTEDISVDTNFMIEYSLSEYLIGGGPPNGGGNSSNTEDTDSYLGTNLSPLLVKFTDADDDGTFEGILPVNLDDDSESEYEASLTIYLKNTTTYSSDPSKGSVYVRLIDDDSLPLISIFGPENISNSNTGVVNFMLSTDSDLESEDYRFLIIRYSVSSPTGLVGTKTSKALVAFFDIDSDGAFEGNLPITLDGNLAADDTLTVALDDVTNTIYRPHPTDNSATMRIGNTESPSGETSPVVSVSTPDRTINEGETARFIINAIGTIPESGLQVNVNVSQTGDYLAWGEKTVEVGSRRTETVELGTIDNNVNDGGGTVTLTLAKGNGYVLHSNSRLTVGTITVEDDDISFPRETLYSVVDHVITQILLNINDSSRTGELETKPADNVVSLSLSDGVINEGEPIRIGINVIPASKIELFVKIELSETGDYIEENEAFSVKIPAGSESTIYEIPTVDDNLSESDGKVKISLRRSNDYLIGAKSFVEAIVTDKADREVRRKQLAAGNQAVLTDLIASVGAGSFESMNFRMLQAFDSETNNDIELAGASTFKEMLSSGGTAINNETMSWKTLLGDSYFNFEMFSEADDVNTATVWGVGDFKSLSKNKNSRIETSKGDVFIGYVGIDTHIKEGVIAGIATSISNAESEYGEGHGTIRYNARTTGFHPYIGLRSDSRESQLDIITGYGFGEVKLDQIRYKPEFLNSKMYNVGLSGNSELYSNNDHIGGNNSISFSGDSWYAKQFLYNDDGFVEGTQMEAGFARISLEGLYELELGLAGKLTPISTLGIRADKRNQKSFFGMEFESGMNYTNPIGIELEGNSSVLMTNHSKIRELGVSGKFQFDRESDGLGLLVNLVPEWGVTNIDDETTLWDLHLLDEHDNIGIGGNGMNFDAEIGYGLNLGNKNSKIVPYSSMQFRNESFQHEIGSRLIQSNNSSFLFKVFRQVSKEHAVRYGTHLEGTFNW